MRARRPPGKVIETGGCGDLDDSGWFRALHAERVDDAAREIILNIEVSGAIA